eukprot:TRINITY_DN2208_c1_g1_i1.p1 TRINITY_DN2208_c1_g1~~TRINITY_DN2208_c1_g1_i1.p1  ORF type:complete len:288 (+),score=98.63 TRINITY_DN2208_c1_g1_i1:63-866(+)
MNLLTAAGKCDGLVPYPLPVEEGMTEEEEVDAMRRQLQMKKTDFEHNAAVREAPTSISGKVWVAAEGFMGQTKMAVGEVEVTTAEKRLLMDETSKEKLLKTRYKVEDVEPAEVRGVYACSAYIPSAEKSLQGHLFVTLGALRFHSDGGYFTVPLNNVLSIQKAVDLAVEPRTAPFFLPQPHPSVAWNALLVYCMMGAVFQFHSFGAGPVSSIMGTGVWAPKPLQKCFLQCDRIWREKVDIDGMVESRCDFANKLPGFIYPTPIALSS